MGFFVLFFSFLSKYLGLWRVLNVLKGWGLLLGISLGILAAQCEPRCCCYGIRVGVCVGASKLPPSLRQVGMSSAHHDDDDGMAGWLAGCPALRSGDVRRPIGQPNETVLGFFSFFVEAGSLCILQCSGARSVYSISSMAMLLHCSRRSTVGRGWRLEAGGWHPGETYLCKVPVTWSWAWWLKSRQVRVGVRAALCSLTVAPATSIAARLIASVRTAVCVDFD